MYSSGTEKLRAFHSGNLLIVWVLVKDLSLLLKAEEVCRILICWFSLLMP